MSCGGIFWPTQGYVYDPDTERGLGVMYGEFVEFMRSMSPEVEAIMTYEEWTGGMFFIPFW